MVVETKFFIRTNSCHEEIFCHWNKKFVQGKIAQVGKTYIPPM